MAEPKKLTSEQRAKVAAWIESHAKGRCPVCGNANWHLAADFVEIRPHYDNVFLGGKVYPQVLLSCSNCAYALMFNAVMIGVLESEPKKDGE
jgi:C4-type Zn-finger protein